MNNSLHSIFTLVSLNTVATMNVVADDYLPLKLNGNHKAALATRTVTISQPDKSCLAEIIFDGATGQLISMSLVLYQLVPSKIALERQALKNIGEGIPCFNVDSNLAIGHIDRFEAPLSLHVSDNRAELLWSHAPLDATAGNDDMQWLLSNNVWCGISLALHSDAQKQAILNNCLT